MPAASALLPGVAWAASGAAGYAIGSVLQARAAATSEGTAVVIRPVYVVGLAFDLLAWAASVVALRTAPLFVVQSVLAISVVLTVLLARLVLGTPVRRREIAGGAVLVGSCALLAGSAGTSSIGRPPGWLGAALLGVLVGTLCLATVLYRSGGWAMFALLGGVSFSGAAVCARAFDLGSFGPSTLVHPHVWLLLAFAGVGAVSYARALEHGPVAAATAVLWMTEVLVPAAVGVGVLGDEVRPGATWLVVVGTTGAVAACWIMASGRPRSTRPAKPPGPPVDPVVNR